MLMNKITQTAVGADLSCTPPIDRPSVGVPNIRIILLKVIIAPIADYAFSKILRMMKSTFTLSP